MRTFGFQPACFRRDLTLPLPLLVRTRSRAKRRTTAMFFDAVAGPVSRQIVLELDIEQPVHAFDTPVAADGLGDAFDVERSGRDVSARVEGRAVGVFGSGADLNDRLDVGEARLARIAALGHDPIDGLRGRVGAGLDAAMGLLDGGFGAELGGRSGGEIIRHIGFERGLVSLEGQQIVGPHGRRWFALAVRFPLTCGTFPVPWVKSLDHTSFERLGTTETPGVWFSPQLTRTPAVCYRLRSCWLHLGDMR